MPVADYTIGADYIYISVGWSDANALVKIVGQMAWTQRLAVAYVSEDSSIVPAVEEGSDTEPRALMLSRPRVAVLSPQFVRSEWGCVVGCDRPIGLIAPDRPPRRAGAGFAPGTRLALGDRR